MNELPLAELEARLAVVRAKQAKLKSVCRTWFKQAAIIRNLHKRIARLKLKEGAQ